MAEIITFHKVTKADAIQTITMHARLLALRDKNPPKFPRIKGMKICEELFDTNALKSHLRYANVPITKEEYDIMEEQFENTKKVPEEWEDADYRPFFGCDERCERCYRCITTCLFGKKCSKCKKRVLDVMKINDRSNDGSNIIMCGRCDKNMRINAGKICLKIHEETGRYPTIDQYCEIEAKLLTEETKEENNKSG